MGKLIWLLLFITCLSSCSKDTDPSGALNGTYNGIYWRTGAIKDTAYVQIVFVGSAFSGVSTGSVRSICNGTYQVNYDSINFTNLCNIPDEDLLLVGKYQMSSVGDSLYFTGFFSGIAYYKDQFNLKKQ